MFSNVLVGLKPGTDHSHLLELTRSATTPPATLRLVAFVRVGVNEDEPERIEGTKRTLEALAVPLRDEGYEVVCETHVSAAAAGSHLTTIAEEQGCDLIVIGLTKRSRVGKALLGSDAQVVLMSAACPVLCERPPE